MPPRSGPGGCFAVFDYARHEPEKTLLHEVIRAELVPLLARAGSQGAPVARFVEREARRSLECGVLAHGFLRVHCNTCGHDRLVAFSCKGRGFCPSCGGRRMADTAAHLVDRVLPEVPIRQWVLTLPYPLRYRCAWNARLTSEVLRCFLRSVFADQRRRSRALFGIRGGQCGSVTFLQRFGSALNLTPHFHSLVLDGVYVGPSHDPGHFAALPPPQAEDVARVLAGTAKRILRFVERRGVDHEVDPLPADDPLMAMLSAASIRSRIATGREAGEPWRRLGDRVDPVEEEEAGVEPRATVPPRCVRQGGMSLHADVAIPARDRQRLERLCRYVARPPLTLDRLEAMADGRLAYRLKTPWRDGTTHVVMERRELLERLAWRDARRPCFLRLSSRTKRTARSSHRVVGSAEARLRGRCASLSGLWGADEAACRHHGADRGAPDTRVLGSSASGSAVSACERVQLGARRRRQRVRDDACGSG